jgi:quercetin dioxygenase-like cupin family protein
MRFPTWFAATTLFPAALAAAAPAEVEKRGQESTTKLEHVVAGPLADLNGRYKLRATEVTYRPGGFIGEHHHAGPGIRCIEAGELTYVEEGKTTVYKPGECFFESGDMTHTARNDGERPVVLLNFEVLTADWTGPTAIPVAK